MNTTYIILISSIATLVLAAIIFYLFLKFKKTDINENSVNDTFSRIATDALDKNSERLMMRVKEVLAQEKSEIRTDIEGKKSAINNLIEEIRRDIRKNEQRLERSDEDRVKSFSALQGELENYKKVTGDLKVSTERLRNLLSNNQMRGAFGEQVADDLLKMAGFVINQNYTRNEAQSNESTRPDFTILLPDKTKINIDVKFPYAALVKSVESEDPVEKKKHFQTFKQDVKEKIKQVCTREYINPEEKTVDFVILFIPNEMIFSYIYENMSDVWEEAMRKKVILAGPFSFTAILRMVKQAYTNFSYQENLQHIIGLIQRFDLEYQKYSQSVDNLGDRILSVNKQFEVVSTTRTRQLTGIVDKIKNQGIIESETNQEIGKLTDIS
ncbi:MAG: DNA recombination protein RmuC [Candidatus Berkelbacteria bacterium]|nr:DNA recombination protein RmuC [Candidatus Berkelbacteria bacterium]